MHPKRSHRPGPCALVIPAILAAMLAAGTAAAAGTASAYPLLRFPDIRGNTVVFVHAEDIWSVPASGGAARRLTLDEGEERYPKLSPDGRLTTYCAPRWTATPTST